MDNMSQNIEIGKFGEKIAANHLKRNGYRILENNFRCKFGEIDIIALHRDTMVFVEVKTRKNNLFGNLIKIFVLILLKFGMRMVRLKTLISFQMLFNYLAEQLFLLYLYGSII